MSDTDPLLQAAVTALTAAFLPQSNNNPTLARQAAHNAILAHNPATGPEVLLVAQAIAFALAAVQAAARSITDPSPSLFRTAAALARSAESCHHALAPRASPAPKPTALPSTAPKPATPTPTTPNAATPNYDWADAIADVAAELRREARTGQNEQHIAALTVAAANLRSTPPRF